MQRNAHIPSRDKKIKGARNAHSIRAKQARKNVWAETIIISRSCGKQHVTKLKSRGQDKGPHVCSRASHRRIACYEQGTAARVSLDNKVVGRPQDHGTAHCETDTESKPAKCK